VTARLIVDSLQEMGREEIYYIPKREEIAPFLLKKLNTGDMVITLGAGSIGRTADELVVLLQSTPILA
jgi:UDP-N-acetylmuramate--alanine ligase